MFKTGPRMLFEDAVCAWTGDEMMMHGTLHYEKHLTFTANLKQFSRKTITLINIGSSVIYYSWEILRPENNFENILTPRKTVKFFFNTCSGVLTPGAEEIFMITFYSREPGLFNETWQFRTRPVLCGGANVWLRLRGAAVSKTNNLLEIAKIEKYLHHQQVVYLVKTMINNIIGAIHPPAKVQVCDESDVFREEEQFVQNNPQLNYHRDIIEELNKIYLNARLINRSWDLSFDTLESAIYDNEKLTDRDDVLGQVENFKEMLEHPRLIPLTMGSYHVTYILWVQTIDSIVAESIVFTEVMNLIIRKRKDLNLVLNTLMISKPEESKKSYLEDVLPSEFCMLMNSDQKIKKIYHEKLYLLAYSLISDMMYSMDVILKDAWF